MIGQDTLYSKRNKIHLPIDDHERSILYLLEKHNILLVVGETGSGKSTRLPQILYSAGIFTKGQDGDEKLICITQPRRVAAMQLAQRVSDDLKCNLGSTVGYAVRFKDVTRETETVIKFMTEGLLIRELLFDPLLKKYSVIIVDEVHERNLNTDILLGLLKCLLLKRNDLKIIVCSATMNVNDVINFFTFTSNEMTSQFDNINKNLEKPAMLCIQGKTYPLKIYYQEQAIANYLETTIETVMEIHDSNRLNPGKILVFLTGQDEVEYFCEKLDEYSRLNSSRSDLKKLLILPLHASLKAEEISRVFEDYGRKTRVCIVSTNVAETSITINDVAFIVDCGFAKIKIFDCKTGVDTLLKVPISKSSAKQRAGRAGRTRDGIVYRLYTESDYEQLDEESVPEIQRTSLLETIMLMKSLGISNLQRFPLISPMPRDNLVKALELLYALQAIDDSGELTPIGLKMAHLNVDPKISRILVGRETSFCTREACKIVAILQVKEIYFKNGRYASDLWSNTNLTNICASEGDLLSYLNIYNGFIGSNKSQKWAEKRNLNYQALMNAIEIGTKLEIQLSKTGIGLNSCNGRLDLIRKAFVAGLFSNAAYLHPCGDYRTIRGDQTVHIHPTSIFSELIDKPKYVVFVELLNTTKAFMKHIMAIESDWLLEAAPHFYTFSTELEMMQANS